MAPYEGAIFGSGKKERVNDGLFEEMLERIDIYCEKIYKESCKGRSGTRCIIGVILGGLCGNETIL